MSENEESRTKPSEIRRDDLDLVWVGGCRYGYKYSVGRINQ
jgi:hypothetical protein